MILTLAALFAVAMTVTAVSAFAAPNCAQVPNNPNCVTENPGGQEHGCQNNKNCTTEFRPGHGGGGG